MVGLLYFQENIKMKLSIRKYHINECITFKSTKGKYGALSNMAPSFPLKINNIKIPNSEILYQALRFPNNAEIQEKLIIFNSPLFAKKYSRNYLNKTREDWNITRFKIMKFCIQLKLFQNFETFSKVLLETGDKPIVEFTEKDKVWGATLEGEYYEGTNALGRLLMELREDLRNNNFKVEIPDIENFYFMNKKITLDSL